MISLRKLRTFVLFLRIPSWLRQMLSCYRSIDHEAGLIALSNRTNKNFSTEDLAKMAKFLLKKNYFEFKGKFKQQILGSAIGTKFAPPYACQFTDEVETSFLDIQEMKPLVWFRCIDDVFFISTHGQEKLLFFIS